MTAPRHHIDAYGFRISSVPAVARRQRLLEQLVGVGIYGDSLSDVVDYLVMRGLDDLLRAGVLQPSAADTAAGTVSGAPIPPISEPTGVGVSVAETGSAIRFTKRGCKSPWSRDELAVLKKEYETAPSVLAVARKHGISKGRLYNLAADNGWSRQPTERRPCDGVIVRQPSARDLPLAQRSIITTGWRTAQSYEEIADSSTKAGYRMKPKDVIAAVAQLGLTNDPDRRRSMHGGGA